MKDEGVCVAVWIYHIMISQRFPLLGDTTQGIDVFFMTRDRAMHHHEKIRTRSEYIVLLSFP